MTTKSDGLETIRYPLQSEARNQAKFPSVRYFQVHFEFMESQLAENRILMQSLQAQIADLTTRLSLMASDTTHLNKPS